MTGLLDESWVPFSSLMLRHIYTILLLCSDYDRFMLETDGRVGEELYKEYTSLGLSSPPNIVHVNNTEDAISFVKTHKVELVISMLDLGTEKVNTFAEEVKEIDKDLHFIILSPSQNHRKIKEIRENNSPFIDHLFYWQGNPSLFLAMIKLIEDEMNADHDTDEADVEIIIFVEDSIRFISSYLPEMYELLIKQNRASIGEALNDWGMKLRMRGRPKILLAKDYDEAIKLYDIYEENILGIITDLTFPSPYGRENAGEYLIKTIREKNKNVPILLQSTEERGKMVADKYEAAFLSKLSPDRYYILEEYFTNNYGFGPFIFRNPSSGEEEYRATNMKELQEGIKNVSIECFSYHSHRDDFSRWLRSQSLYTLSGIIRPISIKEDDSDREEIRDLLYNTIKEYRKERAIGSIAEFKRESYDETNFFTRLGSGSLGGKGRGLAFLIMEMKASHMRKKYPGITLSIPRTIVLSTSLFDEFLLLNDFWPSDFITKDDDTILEMFLGGKVDEKLIKDLRKILSVVTSPLSIRSSSLLEDSHYEPFAGVYETVMISNKGSIKRRLEEIIKAIKTVWASTYFKKAKEYLKHTGHSSEEEKMAVVIEQITGSEHGTMWYPNISGVARSIDYYPSGNRKREDGIATLSYGLGKTVVDGGSGFRFSPGCPSIPILNTQSQNSFYALDEKEPFDPFKNLDNHKKVDISYSYNYPESLRGIASVLRPDGFISEDIQDEGIKTLTFNGIVKYASIPLSQILSDILSLGKKTMGEHVEIEFAVNTEHEKAVDFTILQLRPISSNDYFEDILISKKDEDESLLYSNKVMGNGKLNDVNKIVCIKKESFRRSETEKMKEELEEINSTLTSGYILIVAGRLGSSDSYLGIPVSWSDISNAKVICETGIEELQAEYSEGSHFFQNVTSLGVLYFMNNPLSDDGKTDYSEIMKIKKISETKHFVILEDDYPLLVKADGKTGKGIIKRGDKNDRT